MNWMDHAAYRGANGYQYAGTLQDPTRPDFPYAPNIRILWRLGLKRNENRTWNEIEDSYHILAWCLYGFKDINATHLGPLFTSTSKRKLDIWMLCVMPSPGRSFSTSLIPFGTWNITRAAVQIWFWHWPSLDLFRVSSGWKVPWEVSRDSR